MAGAGAAAVTPHHTNLHRIRVDATDVYETAYIDIRIAEVLREISSVILINSSDQRQWITNQHQRNKLNDIEAERKWPTFSRRHSQMDSLELENLCISIRISLKFVSMVPINIIPALVQMMDWRRPGDTPLSELIMAQLTDADMRHSASMI